MERRIAASVMVGLLACAANGGNVILQWGPHDPNDYEIVHSGDDDVGVHIFANTDPNDPLMFQAYDGNDPWIPGDINYIDIQSTVPVGGLHVSVIPDPGTGRPRGARHLKSLDLATHGDGTNVLDQIDVMGDVGAIAPLYADWAGTLTIGGSVLDSVYFSQDVTGPITIGTLADMFEADDIYGPVSIGTMTGAIVATTVNGAVSIGTMTGEGAVFQAVELNGQLSLTEAGTHEGTILVIVFNDPNDAIAITGNFAGDIILATCGATEPLAGSVTITGTLSGDGIFTHGTITGPWTIGGNLCAVMDSAGHWEGPVHVGGNIWGNGRVHARSELRGTLEVDGHVDPDPEGLARIEIGGTEWAWDLVGHVIIHNGLDGTVRVTKDIAEDASVEIMGGMGSTASVTVSSDTLGTLHITGDSAGTLHAGNSIGEQGTVQIDGDWGGLATGGDVLGTLAINGHVLAGEGARVVVADLGSETTAGHVSVGGENGGLSAMVAVDGSIGAQGLLEINGPIDSGGRIFVGSDVLGSIEVNGNVDADQVPNQPRISIAGAVTGDVLVLQEEETDGLYGTLQVTGTVGDSGLLEIGGDLGAGGLVQVGELGGAIEIDGASAGNVEVLLDIGRKGAGAGPAISVGENLTGQIRVFGSFYGSPADHEVQIGGAAPGAFVVDWDADWVEDTDYWDSAAVVWVAHADPNEPNSPSAEYNHNTPSARMYDVTACLGDMDNSGDVNFPDINPFVVALSNPAQYAALFPGLSGSMVYHGDTTCDIPPHFGFEDINPFIALIGKPCTRCGMEGGDAPMGGDQPLSPEELAKELAANIWPELYADLVAMVAANIELQPDEESQAYWQAVYAALTE